MMLNKMNTRKVLEGQLETMAWHKDGADDYEVKQQVKFMLELVDELAETDKPKLQDFVDLLPEILKYCKEQTDGETEGIKFEVTLFGDHLAFDLKEDGYNSIGQYRTIDDAYAHMKNLAGK